MLDPDTTHWWVTTVYLDQIGTLREEPIVHFENPDSSTGAPEQPQACFCYHAAEVGGPVLAFEYVDRTRDEEATVKSARDLLAEILLRGLWPADLPQEWPRELAEGLFTEPDREKLMQHPVRARLAEVNKQVDALVAPHGRPGGTR